MTEQEWLECTDPGPMLVFLGSKVTDRKGRLFGCACCRRIWHLLRDVRSRQGVEVAERYADNLARRRDLHRAKLNADGVTGTAMNSFGYQTPDYHAAFAAAQIAHKGQEFPWVFSNTAMFARNAHGSHSVTEQQAQAALVRDIFGNPFRPVAFDPAWRTPTVTAMAQSIYAERRFAALPILADARAEAGCTSADLMAHCRSGGDHVRGCWALDLVLDRE